MDAKKESAQIVASYKAEAYEILLVSIRGALMDETKGPDERRLTALGMLAEMATIQKVANRLSADYEAAISGIKAVNGAMDMIFGATGGTK